jgi:hypothetical protein
MHRQYSEFAQNPIFFLSTNSERSPWIGAGIELAPFRTQADRHKQTDQNMKNVLFCLFF